MRNPDARFCLLASKQPQTENKGRSFRGPRPRHDHPFVNAFWSASRAPRGPCRLRLLPLSAQCGQAPAYCAPLWAQGVCAPAPTQWSKMGGVHGDSRLVLTVFLSRTTVRVPVQRFERGPRRASAVGCAACRVLALRHVVGRLRAVSDSPIYRREKRGGMFGFGVLSLGIGRARTSGACVHWLRRPTEYTFPED